MAIFFFPAIWEFWAPRYERLWVQRWSLGPTRRQVIARLENVAPRARRFLDLGCGTGQLAQEIAERFPDSEVLGVDTSPAMIARARARHAHPRVRYLVSDIEALGTSLRFDVVLSTHSFPYIADGEAAMARIRELLAPKGRVLIVHANTESAWDGFVLRLVELTTTPANYRSAAALASLMTQCGLHPTHRERISTAAWVPSIQLVEAMR